MAVQARSHVVMTPDQSLIQRASMRATGADVHRIAQVLQVYMFECEMGSTRRARRCEEQLRAFAYGAARPAIGR